jgi:hypothetical protein
MVSLLSGYPPVLLAAIDYIVAVPILFGVGLLLFYGGFRQYRTKKMVQNTPTETVRAMAAGRTEVTGTAKALGEAMAAPFTDDLAVCAKYEIEEHRYNDDGSDWVTTASGTLTEPFHIDDGTGRVTVNANESLEVLVSDENRTRIQVSAGEPEPEPIRRFLASNRGTDGVNGVDFGGSPLDVADDVDNIVDIASGGGFSGATTGGVAGGIGTTGGVTSGMSPTGGTADDQGGVVDTLFDHRRRYTQEVIPVGTDVYCYGSAREQKPGEQLTRDTEHAEREQDLIIDYDETTERFILSDKTEESLTEDLGRWAPILLGLGVICMMSGFYLAISQVGLV